MSARERRVTSQAQAREREVGGIVPYGRTIPRRIRASNHVRIKLNEYLKMQRGVLASDKIMTTIIVQ